MANVPGAVTDASRVRGGEAQIKTGDQTIPGYLAQPTEPGSHPGIVVIHEAFGLVEHIRDLCRRFANIGYNALAPNLYAREGSPNPEDFQGSVFPKMFAVPDKRAVQDLEAAAAHLRGLPGATGRIGAIGFCSGGRQTLLFACSSAQVDAAVDCWGGFIHRATPDAETTEARPTPILAMVDRLHCPLFAAFGEADENPTVDQANALRDRAQKSGKDVTVKIYQNAGHAFLADYRPSYKEGPAHELWSDLTAFFSRHLR